ncbi:class F sortase [Kitasatospora sp. DSM 101779]|uniref:class F sortase n=1 Tax=Kitasatospora sp. DSM 101779 TaxID=2853165 RepID=UPI0021D9CBC4|nr:class F sortase [Kitasatospora sp. DSM 101779]MCU7820509.1 class F sortase [Kitasatospora sp. DSM 101779]
MPAASAGALVLALGLGTVAYGLTPTGEPVRIAYTGPDAAAPTHSPPTAGAALPGSAPDVQRTASPPVRLLIPRIGVDAPVGPVGLNGDGTVEVPPLDRPDRVGWYRDGAAPGLPGPAVLLGHYRTRKGAAVFLQLPKLRPGDTVQVRREDGRTVSYRVRAIRQFPKSAFPTDLVYGDTPDAQLRLVTCGGTIGHDGHYSDNIVVLADLADGP